MSRFESVNKYITSLQGGLVDKWLGFDGEYFKEKKFYVNNTCLCKYKHSPLTGENILFVSASSITPKCALYLHEITVQASKLDCDVVFVPQWYSTSERHHEFAKEDIIKAFETAYEQSKGKKDNFTKRRLENLLDTVLVVHKTLCPVPLQLIANLETAVSEMQDIGQVNNKEIGEFINNHTYYEIVQAAYFDLNVPIKLKTGLRTHLNPSGEYAFLKVDVDKEQVYSSESICGAPKEVMNLQEASDCLIHWHNKTIRHGMKFGKYTIIKVLGGYLQIGCNKYCKDMFDAFYDEFVKLGIIKE